MAVQATYALYVDWNSNGSYADEGDDISADWMQIRISRGYSSTTARYPRIGTMDVLLKNAAQTYSPPATAAARPRRPVRLTMTYGGSTVTLFEGYIQALRPSSGTKRDRRAVMECVDDIDRLDRFEGPIALQTNTHADDIITSVVAAVYTPAGTSYQAGINVFPTSGDRWSGEANSGLTTMGMGMGGALRQTVRASRKIEDACIADWGRFFIAKDGTPTFYNRHQMPLDASTELTLDDSMIDLTYAMELPAIYNYVTVTCHPRTIGETYEVLGRVTQGTAPMIEASGTLVLDVRFRDPANNAVQMGGKSPITPAATTDYTCTSDEAGEGDDETANVTPTMTAYGDHAEITLTNDVAYPVYVQSLQVRGYAVRTFEPVTVIASDDTSITAYGKRELPVDAVLMSSEIHAQNLADYLLANYKDPRNDVAGVEIIANVNATLMAAVRDLELMDRVSITESQTGLSAQIGHITAMTHVINSKWEHRLVFDAEQAYDIGGDPCIVDSSTVDGADVVIY